MKPYKLKHIPTGLYWQPISSRGSHFSKRGKIYQTKTNILTQSYFSDGRTRTEIWVYAYEDTLIYKEWKDKLVWEEASGFKTFRTLTKPEEWIIEEI